MRWVKLTVAQRPALNGPTTYPLAFRDGIEYILLNLFIMKSSILNILPGLESLALSTDNAVINPVSSQFNLGLLYYFLVWSGHIDLVITFDWLCCIQSSTKFLKAVSCHWVKLFCYQYFLKDLWLNFAGTVSYWVWILDNGSWKLSPKCLMHISFPLLNDGWV